MRTNIDLDDEMLAYVQEQGGHKTKREAVEAALKEYRRRLAMHSLLNMAGKVQFDATAAQLRGKASSYPQAPHSTAYAVQEPLAVYDSGKRVTSRPATNTSRRKK